MKLISQRLRGMHTPVLISLPTPALQRVTEARHPDTQPANEEVQVVSVPTAPVPPPPVIPPRPPQSPGRGRVSPPIAVAGPDTSAWTIPLICFGIALIACCMLIPAADENHQLAWERQRLRLDLANIHKQIEVNDRFLTSVANDPTLLQRLAQRQMRLVRAGTAVLDLPDDQGNTQPVQTSPYLLLNLPPPAPLAPYRPIGGVFSTLCREPRPRVIFLGIALLLIAAGLVLESAPSSTSRRPAL